MPSLQAFLQVDASLANAAVASAAYDAGTNPFGDLTSDGNVDGIIMVNMMNLLPVNGYQFSFSLDPDIVDVVAVIDGNYLQYSGCLAGAMTMGMDESSAATYCEGEGYNSGLQAQMTPPSGSFLECQDAGNPAAGDCSALNEGDSCGSGTETCIAVAVDGNANIVMGFDMAYPAASLPSAYPANPSGLSGQLLAVLVLAPGYTGNGLVDVTIDQFVISGVTPFTGSYIGLNACDVDCVDGTFDNDPDPTACILN
ncbi:uncharacterized protein METZ01_LOCUS456622, partial [marine metagenome]